ncbi:hypothetical protein Q5P01_012720 [Channa striata]|uniref:Ig-like domain-containing protein n=1 Tax=Channa striata TaxID=64152 RepID=A0AA88MQA7_CHASR|nr:hypothetical protein Q5P01_012720 [Channa striata]
MECENRKQAAESTVWGCLQNTTMSLIYPVIICLFFKASSCQPQCVKETLEDKELSINVTEHLQLNLTKDTLRMDALPRGEYEYSFKLEWGCNQTYVFPKRVKISVSALTKKPVMMVPIMMEGRGALLTCRAPLCSARPTIHWKQTKADGQTMPLRDYNPYYKGHTTLKFSPTADDHKTNITCVAEYDYAVIEATVTITVIFPPKILNSSQCVVEGTRLVCVCIGWGNPLPPITWPLAFLTDFSVSSYSNTQTVHSTITMHVADYHNTTVKCISSNELGRAEVEMPLQNCAERQSCWLESRQKLSTAFPWITAVSFTLNLILLISLVICTYKWRKRMQKKHGEELNPYTSLKKGCVEQEYSTISPLPR